MAILQHHCSCIGEFQDSVQLACFTTLQLLNSAIFGTFDAKREKSTKPLPSRRG